MKGVLTVVRARAGGIGGSRSWWWDESLTSILLALLEPASRAPTFQAWLAHDDHTGTKFGHGMGNGYPVRSPQHRIFITLKSWY